MGWILVAESCSDCGYKPASNDFLAGPGSYGLVRRLAHCNQCHEIIAAWVSSIYKVAIDEFFKAEEDRQRYTNQVNLLIETGLRFDCCELCGSQDIHWLLPYAVDMTVDCPRCSGQLKLRAVGLWD